MTDCPRAGRWFGGCKWEARFDEVPNEGEMSFSPQSCSDQIRAMLYHRVYVRDICVRCGETKERRAA